MSEMVLITKREVDLYQNSVTLNDLERRIGPYFELFDRIRRRQTIIRPTSVSKSTFDSL